MKEDFTSEAFIEKVTDYAEEWLNLSIKNQTIEEKKQQHQLNRLIVNPTNKIILAKLMDQCFRSKDVYRIADQINYILKNVGIPDYFSDGEKVLAHLFMGVGRHLPQISVPKIIDKIKKDASRSILSSDKKKLFSHIQFRKEERLALNINWLGESVLGEQEAEKRLGILIDLLKNPSIDYLSVKISAVFSRIRPLAFEYTVDEIVKRLTLLFRAAMEHCIQRKDGTTTYKFINLDMEAYQDLHLTIQAFKKTLEQDEFSDFRAGIVLQAYLPESFSLLKDLSHWAMERVGAGKSPIKVRIVKGANMAMEKIDAIMKGFSLAPFDNKLDVDANYKRMIAYAMDAERILSLNIGIASHNLFDIAFAYVLSESNHIKTGFTFEMLEGMANPLARTLSKKGFPILLYVPIVPDDDFINAIAYLVRRLDENTSPENYLRYAASLNPNTEAWDYLKKQFQDSLFQMARVGSASHRQQDRDSEFAKERTKKETDEIYAYSPEPGTDFSIESNRNWIHKIRSRWLRASNHTPIELPISISGNTIFDEREKKIILDPNQYPDEVIIAQSALANSEDIENILKDEKGWQGQRSAEIYKIFERGRFELKKMRGDIIGALVSTMGMPFDVADDEVTSAINALSFYPFAAMKLDAKNYLHKSPKGVIAVISSSQSPLIEAASGIAAALSTGNRVLLKPSKRALLPSYLLLEALWCAGIPKDVLVYLPFDVKSMGQKLILHPHLGGVIFSGLRENYLKIRKQRPDLWITGQVSGRNIAIVTAMADREQAISHIISSAFYGRGKRRGNVDVLILEKELFKNYHFKEQLKDAVASIKTGSAWQLENQMGPFYYPNDEILKKSEIGSDREYPHPLCLTPALYWETPIDEIPSLNTASTSDLYVIPAKDFDDALDLADTLGDGHSVSIETLDEREIEQFKNRVSAGNLYINRDVGTGGFLKDPFGAGNKNAVGSFIKSGTFHYVTQLVHIKEKQEPLGSLTCESHFLWEVYEEMSRALYWGIFKNVAPEIRKTLGALESYIHNAQFFFLKENKYFNQPGEDSYIRYLPVSSVLIRITGKDSLFEIFGRVLAARVVGAHPVISIEKALSNSAVTFLRSKYGKKMIGDYPLLDHSVDEAILKLSSVERVRYARGECIEKEMLDAAAEKGCYITSDPVLMDGWLELIHYVNNQSISYAYHRHGNLGERGVITLQGKI